MRIFLCPEKSQVYLSFEKGIKKAGLDKPSDFLFAEAGMSGSRLGRNPIYTVLVMAKNQAWISLQIFYLQ
ncbi:MAG: hypothetical protein WBN59_13750 [Flavobacteriaceae bacterium]